MRLLVVEDEKRIADFLSRGLQSAGYAVDVVNGGVAAIERVHSTEYDLIVLDLGLPDVDGLQVLQKIKNRKTMPPVLILSARDSVDDRVKGLEQGADDYLVKPFAFDELLARIRAVLRRAAGRASGILRHDDLTLDPVTRRVQRAGRDIRLTAREFALLQFLLEHAGEVVSRARIVESVWEHDYETFSNVVEVYIRYLRAKIDEPFPHKVIHTVRGVGYSLRSEA
jgi:heavy metal response regulator